MVSSVLSSFKVSFFSHFRQQNYSPYVKFIFDAFVSLIFFNFTCSFIVFCLVTYITYTYIYMCIKTLLSIWFYTREGFLYLFYLQIDVYLREIKVSFVFIAVVYIALMNV